MKVYEDGKSPEVWGPPTWKMLHYLAEGYPAFPSAPLRRHCASFLKALPWMLPCAHCGFHLREFLKSYRKSTFLICASRKELRRFLVEAHNSVSKHTRPDEEPWSVGRASRVYGRGPVAKKRALHWSGTSALVRDDVSERPGETAPDRNCTCHYNIKHLNP